MIISASRRTDIPAFYAKWFMNRIREGYCTVPNPYNPKQISHISLRPEDVDDIVFWTRYPQPLMPFLNELDDRGYRYYFLYTLMNNPRMLEPKSPSYQKSLNTFQRLSRRIGSEKVVWRYDPMVFTPVTDVSFHRETYQRIAEELRCHTNRSIISVLDIYRKTKKRLALLERNGIHIMTPSDEELKKLLESIAASANLNGMKIQSCAEAVTSVWTGIPPGKCIDDGLIRSLFGRDVTYLKDPSQRPRCSCVASRDIGMYDSCLFGCVYCYATTRFDHARDRHSESDPRSPSLTGFFRKL